MMAPLTDVRSGYSLLRSLLKVPDLVHELKIRQFQAAALTDFETLAAAEEYDRLMREAGLFPLIGVSRLWQDHEVRLIALDSAAWPDLVRHAMWDGEPRAGLSVVLGASDDGWWLHRPDLHDRDDIVVELRAHQRAWVSRLPEPWHWVPASRVRYADPGDAAAHRLLAQIGGFSPDPRAEALAPTAADWQEPFGDWAEAQLWAPVDHGSIFSDRTFKMPRLAEVNNEAEELRRLAYAGLVARFAAGPSEKARKRLDYELSTIEQLGFAGYFLMVADVVGWARRQRIRVGPGRGSAAGSLVSYTLYITDVNPLAYGLVFERFLNPSRRTLPDIDLDFEDVRRGEVIQYLRKRHGPDRVAQIGTYGTLGARAVLRDVARALGLAAELVNQVIKSVEWGLDDALADHADALKEASRRAGLGTDWIDRAFRLEGLPRHRSTHAAGVIIAPMPLPDHIYCHGQRDQGFVTDFDMGSLERLGFVKLDVLGLRTLSLVSRIEESLNLPSDAIQTVDGCDPKTLKLLARGDTDGVFQLDGRGVKTLLRQMKPRSRGEIMLVVALYRPGPMEAIGELLRRRASRYRVAADDPLESLLEETYGIMVYQEQLMEAVQRVAGFSMAEADLIRRAISKKDHALLANEGQRLMANMVKRGYGRDAAQGFWEKIRAFGDYGFNKSHAASYGLLSYYLAYLKAHAPVEFWAAELASHENGDKLRELMVQAVSQGITVRPPHINRSAVDFEAQGAEIVAGLSLVRGLGPESALRIVEERERGGPFQDSADVGRRLLRMHGMRALELLEKAGAMKGLGSVARLAASQMQLFESAPASSEPRIDAEAAFGFGWPRADGPIYVRLETVNDFEAILEQIRRVAPSLPGSVPIAVVRGGQKVVRVPSVSVRGDYAAVQALKEIEGVSAAGRHVTLGEVD